MKRSRLATAVAVLWMGAAMEPSALAAATPVSTADLRGTWNLVLVDNVMPDGSRVHLYGDAPQGMLTFDDAGRYSLLIFSGDRPRFASNDKGRGTADEYRTAMQGSNAHYGRYAVESPGTLTFRIAHASFPNWEGTEQKRPFTLAGDRLTYVVPAPTTGAGAKGEVVWVRAGSK